MLDPRQYIAANASHKALCVLNRELIVESQADSAQRAGRVQKISLGNPEYPRSVLQVAKCGVMNDSRGSYLNSERQSAAARADRRMANRRFHDSGIFEKRSG